MVKRYVGTLAVAGAVIFGGGAFAQSNPSADSIINSLRPGAGMAGGTRGIRPLGPSVGAPISSPAPHTSGNTGHATRAPAVAPAAADNAAPSVNLSVQFATNSATLTPAAMRTLDELGRALSSPTLSTYHFRIEGHTDTVGGSDLNQTLSEQRAKAVVDYLVGKFGVDRGRLDPVGMGETHLLVPTGNNVPDARNRRVTVVNTGA